jgi:hypothetical protein
MKSPQAPRRIQEEISVQQVGTETLVYDERRHKAFCLNESSSVIWRLCDGEHSIAQIAAVASSELGTSLSEEFVLFAVEELCADGLIEPSSTVEPRRTVSRRTILQSLGAGGALLLPAVAAIFAPTAAQAYSGCFDCDDVEQAEAAQRARAAAQAANSTVKPLIDSTLFTPIPGSSVPPASAYNIRSSITTASPIAPPANPTPKQGKH